MPFLIIVPNSMELKGKRGSGRFCGVGRSAERNNKSEDYSLME